MEKITIKSELINLDQLLKWANIVSSGGEAKQLIQEGQIILNGTIETRRAKKVYPGDILEIGGQQFEIIRE